MQLQSGVQSEGPAQDIAQVRVGHGIYSEPKNLMGECHCDITPTRLLERGSSYGLLQDRD